MWPKCTFFPPQIQLYIQDYILHRWNDPIKIIMNNPDKIQVMIHRGHHHRSLAMPAKLTDHNCLPKKPPRSPLSEKQEYFFSVELRSKPHLSWKEHISTQQQPPTYNHTNKHTSTLISLWSLCLHTWQLSLRKKKNIGMNCFWNPRSMPSVLAHWIVNL